MLTNGNAPTAEGAAPPEGEFKGKEGKGKGEFKGKEGKGKGEFKGKEGKGKEGKGKEGKGKEGKGKGTGPPPAEGEEGKFNSLV